MAELIPISPAHGLTPVTLADVALHEAPLIPIWSIAPYRGQEENVTAQLKKSLGLGFPAPGALLSKGAVSIAWSGYDQAFLMGAAPDARLSAHAALSDQSDAWAQLVLSGPLARAVLARLVPIDLSVAAFPVGAAARSMLGHMNTLILQAEDRVFTLMIYRSMTATAVHELSQVMRMVDARATIRA
ncbi:sarcosine oxidase subunit gamma [Roseicyclus sp.]|uniref:sarcosine oxidase subunit gamma n=1 Tax=Roseicyclus sp. TaxID=1914329 RepID=UPI003F6ACBEB